VGLHTITSSAEDSRDTNRNGPRPTRT
jgi:hypothetical protein